jgi:hypothetical protein
MDGLEEGRTAFCFCFRLAWITTLVVWEHWDCTILFLAYLVQAQLRFTNNNVAARRLPSHS